MHYVTMRTFFEMYYGSFVDVSENTVLAFGLLFKAVYIQLRLRKGSRVSKNLRPLRINSGWREAGDAPSDLKRLLSLALGPRRCAPLFREDARGRIASF